MITRHHKRGLKKQQNKKQKLTGLLWSLVEKSHPTQKLRADLGLWGLEREPFGGRISLPKSEHTATKNPPTTKASPAGLLGPEAPAAFAAPHSLGLQEPDALA